MAETPDQNLEIKTLDLIFSLIWAIFIGIVAAGIAMIPLTSFYTVSEGQGIVPGLIIGFAVMPFGFILAPLYVVPSVILIITPLFFILERLKKRDLKSYLAGETALFILVWIPFFYSQRISSKLLPDASVTALAFPCSLAATYAFWRCLFGRKRKSA